MKKTVLITGTSSGIGKEASKYFNEQGWNVIATMRSPEKEHEIESSDSILLIKLDVQDQKSIGSAINEGMKRFGRIDLLINNAGYGQSGVFEAITPEKIQNQFDVNVFGTMNVIRGILPHFRAIKSGMILNVSSGAGKFTLPLISIYAASKFALEGFSEALSYELASQNIIIKIVEPGGVSTNFSKVSSEEFAHDPELTDYARFIDKAGKIFSSWRNAKISKPHEVAEAIYNAANDGTNRLRYVIGDDIKPFIQARATMPEEEYINFMRSQFNQA
jgi:short-subunit dehydrogenase